MNKNSVELLGWYGGDEINACSAWTSTNRDLTEEKKNRIPQLLKMLADNGHETPFEKSIVHFLVNTDLASHVHLLKHRISSLNGESARYKELKEDKYYLPEDWKNIFCSWGKNHPFPAHTIDFSDALDDEDLNSGEFRFRWLKMLEWYNKLGNHLYHKALKELEPILGRKRAKESARYFKTYNSQIQADVMFNFRSFVNFQRLRNKEDAQLEIQYIANTMLYLIENIDGSPFKYTLEAFRLKSNGKLLG